MRSSRVIIILAMLLAIGATVALVTNKSPFTEPPGPHATPSVAEKLVPTRENPPQSSADRSMLADGLNDPGGTIQDDLRIVSEIFGHWTSNFPRQGNPVGTNAEITRALTGANRLQLSLVPPDLSAINREGELIDRWGTPFRFHQWSGFVTEVISAGPDRDFATADDVSSQ